MIRLSFDLGSNSIGYAVVLVNTQNEVVKILRSGTRIFSDGRDGKKNSLGAGRREARSARRALERRVRRKKKLLNKLVAHGFLSADKLEQEKIKKWKPYLLRYKAINEKVTLAEIARILFHLNQKRGPSNIKLDKKTKGESLRSITNFEQNMKASNARTVGEFLYYRHKVKLPTRAREGVDLLYTRKMLLEEFNLIRDTQNKYHNISADVWKIFEDTIFNQRPLKLPKRGNCTIYQEESRVPKAYPSYQLFRLLQDISNLKIITGLDEIKEIPTAQKEILLAYLSTHKELKIDRLIKIIPLLEGERFNLEVTKILGDTTAALLSKKEIFGKTWNNYTIEEKDAITAFLLAEGDEQAIIDKATQEWCLSDEQANNLCDATCALEDSCCRFGQRALLELCSAMRPSFIPFPTAKKTLNYLSTDVTGMDDLKYYGEILPDVVMNFPESSVVDESMYGKIGNPTVHRCLNELRVVVNLLIEKYGKPDQIHVEVNRELKSSSKQKRITEKQKKQAANKSRVENILIKNHGLPTPSPYDIIKYQLWEELNPDNPHNRRCPYPPFDIIREDQLFTCDVEIDHIIPQSRCLDNSQNNKTVVFRSCNQFKNDSTPYERFGDNVCIEKLPIEKQKRFGKDVTSYIERMTLRHLNDTAYYAKIAKRYLQSICDNVWAISGSLTSFVRSALSIEKDRMDYRHHAVDAIIVSLINKNLTQKIMKSRTPKGRITHTVNPPWESFQDDLIKAKELMLVSHRKDTSISGAFTKKTAFGIKDGSLYYKVNVNELITDKQIKDMSDEKIKNTLLSLPVNERLKYYEMRGIKKLRCLYPTSTTPIEVKHKTGAKAYLSEENHHIDIWKLPAGVTSLNDSSYKVYKNKNMGSAYVICNQTLFNMYQAVSTKPHPSARLVMSLYKNDVIILGGKYVRVVGLTPTNGRIVIGENHIVSKPENKKVYLTVSSQSSQKNYI
jgi:CRISPR-associated endonuclease Csn1